MLEHMTRNRTPEFSGMSDRKLRLFAITVARHGGCGSWADVSHLLHGAERMAEGQPHGLSDRKLADAHPYVASWLIGDNAFETARRILLHCEPDIEDRESGPAQAALLRCIVGNPFRPVTLPKVACRRCGGSGEVERYEGAIPDGECSVCDGSGRVRNTAWLTPDVLAIAAAAYDERGPDGTLDAVRLAILADALEEVGASETQCWSCQGRGDHLGAGPDRGNPECDTCHGTGRLPNPLVAHLRDSGPHVRGCWSLDCILGRS